MEDYCLSNDYFNIFKVFKYVYNLLVNLQEVIIIFFLVKEDFFNVVKDEIEWKYGDVFIYL